MKIIILMTLFLVGCSCKNPRVEKLMIMSVGGCDRYGDCGVLYSDGTLGIRNKPVVGQFVERRICR